MSIKSQNELMYDDSWSSYKIDYLSFLVFQSLQQNPLETLSHMSKELGVSITVINNRFQRLKSRGFFRKEKEILVPFLGRRMQNEVEAVYSPESLGLDRFHVFISGIRDVASFKKLDYFMSINPYTHYSSGSFNGGANLYCQFDMPPDSKRVLSTLLKKLQEEENFEDFTIFRPIKSFSNGMDFTQWDIEQRSWQSKSISDGDISLGSELDLYFYDITENAKSNTLTEHAKNKSYADKFDIIDMKLIRELTVNAKISTVELSRLYKLDQSRISRRLSRLRQNVIKSNLLFFDQSAFNLQYPTLFVGNFASNDPLNMNTFQALVNQGSMPFSSSLSVNPNKFVWMVTLPTLKIIDYSKFLWKHTKKLNILNLDLSTSRRFYFLHNNYLGDGKWNTDKEYTVNRPLDLLRSLDKNNIK